MHVLSVHTLFALSGLLSAAVADSIDAKDEVLTSAPDLVTVVVHSTITTCPSAPPSPPCSVSSTTTSTVTISSRPTDGSSSTSPSTGPTGSSSSGSSGSSSSPSSSPTPSSSSSSSPSSSSSSSSGGSSSSSSTTTSERPTCTDYWLGKIKHQGIAPFADAGYKVFRNVQEYGAKGDGITDDTDAINLAISDGGRCGPGVCSGSTTTPALVYFPPGTYLVTKPIIDYYYTQVIGNPECLPVIKASADFAGPWVFDSNPYGFPPVYDKPAWTAVNVFWRQVANFVFDLRDVPASSAIAAIHWPSSQATSLANIVFHLSAAPNTKHQGLFIEEGSGGYVGDLVFNGGAEALSIGNQQFTFRNITINGAKTAVKQLWSWGWTYIGVSINNCEVGFDFTATDKGVLTVGSITILDSSISNTPVGIAYGNSSANLPPVTNNLMLENVNLDNVAVAIRGPTGPVLPGSAGKSNIAAWGRGNAYTPTGPDSFEGPFTPNPRPASLLAGADYYTRSKPQYEGVPVSDFLSVRSAGCAGDGVTDDTAALNKVIADAVAANKIVFIDNGYYLVTGTIYIPAGARITGESFPIILSSGAFFADAANPKPVVQVGKAGETGSVEWSNTIVSTRGEQPGAIVIEYNLASPSSTPTGLWDVHVRIGGFAGSELQLAQCAKTPEIDITPENLDRGCIAAFLSFHITTGSSGLLMENCWVWVADHDLEIGANNQQITVYAGRGMLIESEVGAIWLYGTGVEHHQLYEYQLVGSAAVVMGQIQTETAYYQPNPDAIIPFPAEASWHDPVFAAGESGWGLRVVDSEDILVYGAGLYSFFDNYNVSCSQVGAGAVCQTQIFSVERSSVSVYNLNTIGTTKMATVDGVDVADFDDNMDGFVQTIALFRNEL